jgi:hypothetical protein
MCFKKVVCPVAGRRLVALLVLLMAVLPAPSALANSSGPRNLPGHTSGPILPRQDTAVRVDAEDLRFVLDPGLRSAGVTATYGMTNTTDHDASTEIAFVYVDRQRDLGQESAITVDGAPVAFRRVTDAEFFTSLVDEWLATHPAVHAEMKRLAAEDRETPIKPGELQRLLSPARAWAGFGALDVHVDAPPETSLQTTFPLARSATGYAAHLSGLPDGELLFTVRSTQGVILGVDRPNRVWALFLLVMAVPGAVTGGFLGRRWAAVAETAETPRRQRLWLCLADGGQRHRQLYRRSPPHRKSKPAGGITPGGLSLSGRGAERRPPPTPSPASGFPVSRHDVMAVMAASVPRN